MREFGNAVHHRVVLVLTTNKHPLISVYIKHYTFYRTSPENYKFSLALAFTLDEVKRNTVLLPNKSLLFDFSADDCMSMSQLYSLHHENLPNYMCKGHITCRVLLTGPNWESSAIIWRILQNKETNKEANKPWRSIWWEIIKLRAEINKMETRRTIQRINITKSLSLIHIWRCRRAI